MDLDFDYIIIGAGSAGSVIANRLSSDPKLNVCLVEAGPKNNHPLIRVPLGLIFLIRNQKYNWLFNSQPQLNCNRRKINIPRGKVLGGSSSINGMIYIRGHKEDYNNWFKNGCVGWDYNSILPYFKRSEKNTNFKLDESFHGFNGELTVSDLTDPHSLSKDFINAAKNLQIQHCNDFNLSEPEGVGIYQVNQKHGKRVSTADAFLKPISKRNNLQILANTYVKKILFSGNKAIGILIQRKGCPEQILKCKGEIICSLGTIGTPDLLLKSGIGSGSEIKDFGGTVIADVPGVGKNLHDHVDIMTVFESSTNSSYGISLAKSPYLIKETIKWVLFNRGMFASNMVESGGFIKTENSLNRPDIQFHFIPIKKSTRGRLIEFGHGVSLHTCVLRPRSRGQITRVNKDGPPLIDLGLLNNDYDLNCLIKGLKIGRRIINHKQFENYGITEIFPGKEKDKYSELSEFVRNNAKTVYHPVGTCAMGTNYNSVVDPRLRVKGIKRLRIADASIMPNITSGNTNAPTIMIAEKASDMILEDKEVA